MGELEKCLDDHEKLPELFIKHVCETHRANPDDLVVFLVSECVEVRLTFVRLYTGAKAAHVCCLLPEQTKVGIHCG